MIAFRMKQIPSALTRCLLAVLVCAAASCAAQKKPARPMYSTEFNPTVIQPQNRSAVRVKISTGAQRLYVTEGDKVLIATPCSVGRPGSVTPAGHHRILSKTFDRRRNSQPGRGYPMTYWMSFYDAAYGMHWGFVKPYPCTHGCVRLPIKSAKAIFNMVSVGTPVHVAASHPEDEIIGRTLPILDDTTLPDPPDSYMMSPKVFSDAAQGKFYTF
jgi:lipoprotein-anchoring transpeptidase ErfK/SrfK